jgi:hypothetical protein
LSDGVQKRGGFGSNRSFVSSCFVARRFTAAKPEAHSKPDPMSNFSKFLKDFNNFSPNFGLHLKKQIVSMAGLEFS